jgi:hypothetical protein
VKEQAIRLAWKTLRGARKGGKFLTLKTLKDPMKKHETAFSGPSSEFSVARIFSVLNV